MESLQLSQVLADLSNIGAADPGAAEAIVSANNPSHSSYAQTEATAPVTAPTSSPTTHQQRRPTGLQRHWSSEKFDKFGRRILSPGSHSGSVVNSSPGTPRRGELDVRHPHQLSPLRRSWDLGADRPSLQFEEDLERASTLMQLYDIRSKIKQQDNSSLLKAREKVNAIAARQQAQQAAERNMKAADELRRQRYSFPRAGL
ncbi:pyruvate carboxylase [Fusarium austroafricanum]|uniref:Pyruvate carboxylase n=1 Tax=Fusarium austroafricanum TaxID=2364996 RepID=A0A8H4K2C2_9HYPO|nr:pyruvate carboxylase [Fusarium austroafricanum]